MTARRERPPSVMAGAMLALAALAAYGAHAHAAQPQPADAATATDEDPALDQDGLFDEDGDPQAPTEEAPAGRPKLFAQLVAALVVFGVKICVAAGPLVRRVALVRAAKP